MSYEKKLKQFNSTEKYKTELEFLNALIGQGYKYVLDYGCGTGEAANYLQLNTNNNVAGYDKTKHNEKFWYVSPSTPFDTVYFMHSIAHIENVEAVLIRLDTKRVVVITPNAEWLALQRNKDYTPDPTIKRHYTQKTLCHMFGSVGYNIIQVGQFGAMKGNQNERLFLIAEKI